MVDTRFHSFAGPSPLSALLAAVGLSADALTADPLIAGAEELSLAGSDHIALAGHIDYRDALRGTAAAAVIVSQDLLAEVPVGSVGIVVKNRIWPSFRSSISSIRRVPAAPSSGCSARAKRRTRRTKSASAQVLCLALG